ncbi:hypothetical protein CDL12_07048 [Handroanthus impetiginosus]|uniref:Magnesium transporter n=1 Tax=Handroanthus impetiginosus TaxID=429701 RepID=A0A2G9HRW6_9LAMI|nr:hypothetical protein CDL12_07048 [Handroanthus impetiginosus]
MSSSTPLSSQYSPNLLHLPLQSPQFRLLLAGISLSRSKCELSRKLVLLKQQRSWDSLRPVAAKEGGIKCFAEAADEKDSAREVVLDKDGDGEDEVTSEEAISQEFSNGSASSQRIPSSGDSLSLGIREPVYEVVEVRSNGMVSTRKINRRHLLKSSGLRPRDVRSVDPSLWLTNSMPSLLVREHAILLNLGSLRAIAMQERVYIFNYNRKGGKAFIDTLLPRLNPKNMNGGPSMPFVLEVVEAAFHSRTQRLERRLMDLEPRVKEEEEIEMLLENYLQRCESCHGQAERLLDSAKEMEDSIAVNLSSRRLEVSRVELLLQVGTFCVAVGALVAGIFGMNLRSYLEEHLFAFWLTTAGIFVGAVVGFFLMYYYLRRRKIL